MRGVEVIRATTLGQLPHGFLSRRGGVSQGECAGLNVGFGSRDERSSIAENRRLAIEALLPGAGLATVHQIHGATIVNADQAWQHEERPRGDGMVTDRPGLLLGILTADCAPVLFADHQAQIVGAAHAGWRGAIAGVTDATIDAMERLGAKRGRIHAAIGPCVAQISYEVDEAFRSRFLEEDPDNRRFFSGGSGGKPHFDLEAYIVHRLIAAGIEEIEALGLDTYADPDRFFSFRRSTHCGEADYGRHLGAIGLAP